LSHVLFGNEPIATSAIFLNKALHCKHEGCAENKGIECNVGHYCKPKICVGYTVASRNIIVKQGNMDSLEI